MLIRKFSFLCLLKIPKRTANQVTFCFNWVIKTNQASDTTNWTIKSERTPHFSAISGERHHCAGGYRQGGLGLHSLLFNTKQKPRRKSPRETIIFLGDLARSN